MTLIQDQELTFSHQYTLIIQESHAYGVHKTLDIPNTQVMNTFYHFENPLHVALQILFYNNQDF